MKKITLGRVIQILFCIIILVTVVFPMLWLLLTAFKANRDIVKWPPTFWPGEFSLSNYFTVFDRIPLGTYIKNTIIFAVLVGLCSAMLDSMAGYAFARLKFKGRDALFNIVLLTMLIPFQIIMIPLFIEMTKVHLINTFLGLIIPRMASAYGIFFMKSFFISLPKELEEAARIDGLGEFGIYARIMFPLCKPAFITFFIFCLTTNWNDLLYPLMMTNSTEMRTLPAGLAMFVGEGVREVGPAMAGAIISMLPLLVLYCFCQRYFVAGIAVSGMKE